MARESKYQKHVIDELREIFPDCIILKNDANYLQGVPDLTIFWGDRWATLEVKTDEDAPYEPNQEYYVHRMNQMSFSAFIYPENEEEVLSGLQRSFCN